VGELLRPVVIIIVETVIYSGAIVVGRSISWSETAIG
jgi:hypothetical protein